VAAVDAARLLVLLLPEPLERFAARAFVEELLRERAVVAVDPPRARGLLARLPDAVGAWMAYGQAGRLKLRGEPAAVCLFGPLQYALARGLIARHPECELWYVRLAEPAPGAATELDLMARERAARTFGPDDGDEVWAAVRALGLA
jgi:hypothetical protein